MNCYVIKSFDLDQGVSLKRIDANSNAEAIKKVNCGTYYQVEGVEFMNRFDEDLDDSSSQVNNVIGPDDIEGIIAKAHNKKASDYEGEFIEKMDEVKILVRSADGGPIGYEFQERDSMEDVFENGIVVGFFC